MTKLLALLKQHGEDFIPHAVQALPSKSETEIRRYFHYLSSDFPTGSIPIDSTVKGLIYTSLPTPLGHLALSQMKKTSTKQIYEERSFGGYISSDIKKEGTSSSSKKRPPPSMSPSRTPTKIINIGSPSLKSEEGGGMVVVRRVGNKDKEEDRDGRRDSLQDQDNDIKPPTSPQSDATLSLPPSPPPKNHLLDWKKLIEDVEAQRFLPFSDGTVDFSEALISALQNCAAMMGGSHNQEEVVVNGKPMQLRYSNFYKYIFCLLKGVPPIALSPIESGILLEMIERLEKKVKERDCTDMKKYLGHLRDLTSHGHLNFDPRTDRNVMDNSYKCANAQPDLFSINPLCITPAVLTPRPETKPSSENVTTVDINE